MCGDAKVGDPIAGEGKGGCIVDWVDGGREERGG